MKYGLSPPMRAILADMLKRKSQCTAYYGNEYHYDAFYDINDITRSLEIINEIRKEVVFYQLQDFLANKVIKPS